MAIPLDQDRLADVIKLFINEGVAIAGAKPKQLVIAPDSKRILVINAAGNAFEIGVSDDSLQLLLAGPQNITGAKTFDASAIFNQSLTSNLSAIFGNIFGFTPVTQQISTDNTTLLNSDVNSYLQVTNNLTGQPPTSYTVGMKAGTINGQICHIQVSPTYAIEIDPNVATSASIRFENAAAILSIKAYDATSESVGSFASFRWDASATEWQQILTSATGSTPGNFTAVLTGVSGSPASAATFVKTGDSVILQIPQILGTSNSITCTITGIPTNIRPIRATDFYVSGTSSGVISEVRAAIETDGTITLANGLIGSASGWINDSLLKGIRSNTFSYLVT